MYTSNSNMEVPKGTQSEVKGLLESESFLACVCPDHHATLSLPRDAHTYRCRAGLHYYRWKGTRESEKEKGPFMKFIQNVCV